MNEKEKSNKIGSLMSRTKITIKKELIIFQKKRKRMVNGLKKKKTCIGVEIELDFLIGRFQYKF